MNYTKCEFNALPSNLTEETFNNVDLLLETEEQSKLLVDFVNLLKTKLSELSANATLNDKLKLTNLNQFKDIVMYIQTVIKEDVQ